MYSLSDRTTNSPRDELLNTVRNRNERQDASAGVFTLLTGTEMKDHHRHQLWLLVIAAAVLLTGLHTTRLWDQDEGYFASTAAEMHAQGDWIVPTFNGELFGHKPPWMYWMMMIGYELFGTSEFAARILTAVFGVATCLLTYHLGRRVFTAQAGWWAGLVMASCLMFNFVSRAATPDTYLTFFSTLALYLFAVTGPYRERPETSSTSEMAPSLSDVLPQRWTHFVAIYAAMGVATLVKGPIGFLFPMAVIGLFLLCTTPRRKLDASAPRWRQWLEAWRPFGPVNFFQTIWRMRIFTAIAVILLVAGPWYIAVGWKTNGVFLQEFFGVHHFHRFSTPMDSHKGPFYYYIVSILVGMFPWSVFALPTFLLVIRHLRTSASSHRGLLLMTCWASVYVVIFSLASTKLPNYILPAYPALAVLAAYFYQYWIDNPASVHRFWPRIALGILALVGMLGLIGLPLAGAWQWNGQTLLDRVGLASDVQSQLAWLGLVGAPATIAGCYALYLAEQGRSAAAVKCIAWTGVLSIFGVWNIAAPQIAHHQINGRIGAAIQQHVTEASPQIAEFGYFPPSLSFYVRHRIDPCSDKEATQQFMEDAGPKLLITTTDGYESLKGTLHEDVAVVEKLDRFPEKGQIVILYKGGSSPQRTAHSPSKSEPPIR